MRRENMKFFLFDLEGSSDAATTHALSLSLPQPENVKNGKPSDDLHREKAQILITDWTP